jgi:dTDP-4-dehydrorhamnose reductase
VWGGAVKARAVIAKDFKNRQMSLASQWLRHPLIELASGQRMDGYRSRDVHQQMNILLLGKNGQVGWELQRSLAPLGRVVALDRKGWPAGAARRAGLTDHDLALCGDLSQLDALAATVQVLRPQVIVNAAAYTAVDRAESEPGQAERINGEAPGVLAEAARDGNALLVHYSSDYVFDGTGTTPWREDDALGPLSVYGRSKALGEQNILATGCAHLIFRTSWVYAARGANFARTLLRLACERERLTVIDDQVGVPTGAELIADITAQAIAQLRRGLAKGGIYHLAPEGETTWYRYACHVLEYARARHPNRGWKVQTIDPIPTSAFPTPAMRPHNSRLDTTRLQETFGVSMPPWQAGVERMLDEISWTDGQGADL